MGKGIAWVEFADKEVSKIAQESMDGYLMFGKKISVKFTPESERPPRLFLAKYFLKVQGNWLLNRRKHFIKKFNQRDSLIINGEKIPQRTVLQEGKYRKRQNKLKGMLENFGIDFDVNGATAEQDLDVYNDAVVKGTATKPNPEKKELKKTKRKAFLLAKKEGTVQETAAAAKKEVESTPKKTRGNK